MAPWSANHRACTTTWTTLRVLAQIPLNLPFSRAGTVTMKELTFWNQAGTPDLRRVQASALAAQMDNVFRLVRRAQFEPGVEPAQAVSAIANTLLGADNTLADLAEVNDANYLFWGEDVASA